MTDQNLMEEIQLTFSLQMKEDGLYRLNAITFDKNTTDLESDSDTLERLSLTLTKLLLDKKQRSLMKGQDILNKIDFESE